MSIWRALARSFIRDDRGQAITEYILLLTFTTAGAVALARTMLSLVDRITLTLGGQLEKDLKTGRTHLNVWKN